MDKYPPRSRIAGRYEVASLPLMGGMGIVYICFDHLEQRPVALKTFQPEYLPDRAMRDRFLRQGTTWLELGKHPHIVRCYGVEHIGDRTEVYLVLELVAKQDGRKDASLRSWLVPGSAMGVEPALLFGLQVARGMKYALEKIPGFVHRDLKPENILVGADRFGDTNINRIRVTDFDLVSVVKDLDGQGLGNKDGTSSNLIRTQLSHGIAGTPHYMSPEQWKGEGICVQTDMYAFGCILYEMLVGQPVVEGMSVSDLEQSHLAGKLRSFPRGLPDVVTGLVHRCVHKKPQDRYGDWGEMETAIGSAYRQVSGQAVPAVSTTDEEDREERVAMGWAYNALGMSYLDIDKPAVAKTYFERVLTTAQAEHDRNLEAASLTNLGLTFHYLGDPRSAIGYHEQGLTIARETRDRNVESNILNNLGLAHRDLGDTRRAIGYHEQGLTIARETGDRNGEGRNLCNLGIAYKNLGDFRKAIGYYEKSLTIARETGDRKMKGASLCCLGGTYIKLDEPSRAIEYYGQSLVIARETGDRNGEGRILCGMGLVYKELGDTHRAIEYYEQSLAINRQIGDRIGEGGTLNNLGLAYDDMGDALKAIAYFDQSLTIFREIGDRSGEGTVLGCLGMAYYGCGDDRRTIEYYEPSLEIFHEIGDQNGEGRVLVSLGLVYIKLGGKKKARGYLEQALSIFKAIDSPMAEGVIQILKEL